MVVEVSILALHSSGVLPFLLCLISTFRVETVHVDHFVRIGLFEVSDVHITCAVMQSLKPSFVLLFLLAAWLMV